jgi:phosphopantothenoylcysteine decarboxylase/phosphopantothenate--cysteine ligase
VARILCAVTGSIAAYKAAEVVSRLVQLGHEVHVVMTRAATELVRPRTFSALSRRPVHSDLWDPMEAYTEHVSLAELPDVAVIAPATANILGKLAHGIADEIVSTTMLAVTAPVLVAPAMNVHMYRNPVVQENIRKLTSLGYRFLAPGEGYLACGDVGPGRMTEPAAIVAAVTGLLAEGRPGTRPPEGGEVCGG